MKLTKLISPRSDAAHRANTSANPDCDPHVVKRDELKKALRLLKGLLVATGKVKVVK